MKQIKRQEEMLVIYTAYKSVFNFFLPTPHSNKIKPTESKQ